MKVGLENGVTQSGSATRKRNRNWTSHDGFPGSDAALLSLQFYYATRLFIDRYGDFVCLGNRIVKSDLSNSTIALNYSLIGYLEAEATFVEL